MFCQFHPKTDSIGNSFLAVTKMLTNSDLNDGIFNVKTRLQSTFSFGSIPSTLRCNEIVNQYSVNHNQLHCYLNILES